MSRRLSRASIAFLLVIVAALITPGCLFRKKKLPAAPELPLAPVRVVLLPANVPQDNHDLRWLSLGVTVLMAKQIEDAQDLEVVPLWESIPITLETLGATRTVDGETPAYVASRLNAKWATQINLTPDKKGISLLIDFMPTKATMFAYRYEAETSVESIHTALQAAIEQFLRYLQVRPLVKGGKGSKSVDPKELLALAEALDREHGWFSPADPGKAEKTFAGLARSDTRLARLLFKPASSSESGDRPPAALPGITNAPLSPATPTGEANAAPQGSSPQPRVSSPPPSKPPEVPASEIIKSTRGGGSGKTSSKTSGPDGTKPPAAPSESSSKAPPEIKPFEPPKVNDTPNARSTSELAPVMTYWIEVNATVSKSEAEAHAERYAKAGFHPEVVQAELKDKGPGYRVRLKGFDSRKAAEEAAQKLVTEGLIKEYWIVP